MVNNNNNNNNNKTEPVGGIKGFFQKASLSFSKGGTWLSTQTMWLSQKALYVGFVIASTSFITLMPLLFEIGRETQVRIQKITTLPLMILAWWNVVLLLLCASFIAFPLDSKLCFLF